MSQTAWYLLQFKPNAHQLAVRNLQRQGFETFLPMQKVTRRATERFVNTLRPLFPGYMFVSLAPDTAPWRKINATLGVSRLVSFDGAPRPMPEALIKAIMQRCDRDGKLTRPNDLKSGDQVSMLTGPFADAIATIEKIDANQRIWVLMDIMGQQTRVSVASKEIELARLDP